VVVPLAAAAALDPSVFSRVNASEAIPASWEEQAPACAAPKIESESGGSFGSGAAGRRKAWEYYVEEPLVKNCVNSWRTFAVGDEIKITSGDEDMKWEAIELADRLGVSASSRTLPANSWSRATPSVSSATLHQGRQGPGGSGLRQPGFRQGQIRPGETGEAVIADFGLGIADYLRDRAVFMEATTIERISFASFFRSTKRFSSINPASEISSIQ